MKYPCPSVPDDIMERFANRESSASFDARVKHWIDNLNAYIQMRRDLHDDEHMPRLSIYGSHHWFDRVRRKMNPFDPRNPIIKQLQNLRDQWYDPYLFRTEEFDGA